MIVHCLTYYHIIPQLTNQNQAETCTITEFLMQQQDKRMCRFSFIVSVSCCVHGVMDKWLNTFQRKPCMLQQNACWDAWRVLNQGLSLWVKICQIKSHEVSRGCKRTITMARNGRKKWLCSLFKTLQFLYFKLKSYPIRIRAETLMPSGDTQGHVSYV